MIAGFRTGRYRWLAAVLLALTALCHVIVGIFVVIAASLALVVWPGWSRAKWLAAGLAGRWVAQRVLDVPVRGPQRVRERHGLGEAAVRHGRSQLELPARPALHQRPLPGSDLPRLPRAEEPAVDPRARHRRASSYRSSCASASGCGSGSSPSPWRWPSSSRPSRGSGTRGCCPSTTSRCVCSPRWESLSSRARWRCSSPATPIDPCSPSTSASPPSR